MTGILQDGGSREKGFELRPSEHTNEPLSFDVLYTCPAYATEPDFFMYTELFPEHCLTCYDPNGDAMDFGHDWEQYPEPRGPDEEPGEYYRIMPGETRLLTTISLPVDAGWIEWPPGGPAGCEISWLDSPRIPVISTSRNIKSAAKT